MDGFEAAIACIIGAGMRTTKSCRWVMKSQIATSAMKIADQPIYLKMRMTSSSDSMTKTVAISGTNQVSTESVTVDELTETLIEVSVVRISMKNRPTQRKVRTPASRKAAPIRARFADDP